MKHLFVNIVVAIALIGLAAVDAEARRLGGARSFGKQQSAITSRQATPPAGAQNAAPASANPAAAPAAAGSATPTAMGPAAATGSRARWLGPVAGIAAGLGLAALFSHLGFGAELAALLGNVLLIALVVFVVVFVWRTLRGRTVPARPQPAYAQRGLSPDALSALGREGTVYPQPSAPLRADATLPTVLGPRPVAPPASFGVPAGFDTDAFTRNAKIYFVRLQAAWDAGNLNDIREFTTPEMYAEIRQQLEERGLASNQTDVVTLDAEVLGVASTDEFHMASVRFHGMLREQEGAPAEAFDEVWNLTKPVEGHGGWVLAGIQQVQTEPSYGAYA